MSTDSSDSEKTQRFREAVDENFLTEELFQNEVSDKKQEDCRDSQITPPSLRKQNNKFESINPFSIKVTPEFQHYVSQHLSKMLDQLIQEDEATLATPRKKKKKKGLSDNDGIKLLKKSKSFVNVSLCNLNNTNSVRRVAQKESDDDIEEKAKEAAVSPEWVLSKKETEFWAPTKGEVEIVLVNNGNKLKKKKKKKNNQPVSVVV